MPSYLDLAVIIIVLISGLLALLRGFTREILGILSWVAAAAAAVYLHKPVIPYVNEYAHNDKIALYGAIALVFFVALILVSVVTVKLSDIILDSKIGALDRTLGFIFGALRGLLLAVVAFMLYSWLLPDATQPDWVKNARTKPILQAGGDKLREMLPDDVYTYLDKYLKKKGVPANEEPPAEPEIDSGKEGSPSTDSNAPAAPAPEKPSETGGRTDAPAAAAPAAPTPEAAPQPAAKPHRRQR